MVDFQIVKSRRKTISIEVQGNGKVVVRAPYRMPNYRIKEFITQKENWINKHVKQAESNAEKYDEIEPLTAELLDELFEDAKRTIPRKVAHFAELMDVTYGRITIRNQKTRWGSCSSKGNLNFNCLLMLAPDEVIDYVVVHELAHRKEMNHSKAFWSEVEKVIPDYKDKRKWLKDNGDIMMQRMLRMV